MNSVAFDTLKFARALREKAMLTPEQAEGFAEAIADVMHDDLATKADVLLVRSDAQIVKTELQAEIEKTKSELQAQIEKAKTELQAQIEKTKSELQAHIETTRSELQAQIETTRSQLEARIEASKAEVVKWMFGTIGFQTLIILGAVVTLAKALK